MTQSSIDDGTLIAKAQAYVGASNAHDMAGIAGMLAPEAIYRSSGVGEHIGADAIITMTRSFHAANPDVHWAATNYRVIAGDGVEFDFVITLGGQQSPGVERVFFDAGGRIRRVEVER